MQHSCLHTCQHVDETSVGRWNLYTKIDKDNLQCYNEKHDDSVVESDDEQELLFSIPFNGAVKITGLCIIGENGPSHQTTQIYYVGLRGEYLGVKGKSKVVITTYEARPQLKDHKVNDFLTGNREIQ
ncbi:unnamed protein product [Rotaria sp. Silwood2]|nr:unnamed protein product [Rotaria sp. Silwood2]CAF4457041.1 unnamed protein product [Rotaria sp. Silwood2]